jgi:hypothetical protein
MNDATTDRSTRIARCAIFFVGWSGVYTLARFAVAFQNITSASLKPKRLGAWLSGIFTSKRLVPTANWTGKDPGLATRYGALASGKRWAEGTICLMRYSSHRVGTARARCFGTSQIEFARPSVACSTVGLWGLGHPVQSWVTGVCGAAALAERPRLAQMPTFRSRRRRATT